MALDDPRPTMFSFDTGDFPEDMRFAAWRDMMSAYHDVSLLPDDGSPFHGRLTLWRLDDLMMSSGVVSPQAFFRTTRNIRRDHMDHYALLVQGRGHRIVQARETETVVRAGDLLVADFARPLKSLASDGESGTVYLPRDLVDAMFPDFACMHGNVIRGTASRLLTQHVLELGRLLPRIPVAAQSHLVEAARSLALACLIEHVDTREACTAPVEDALRYRIERYIDAHLTSPDLDAASICGEFQISRSTLYRVFRGQSGVASFIKLRRLHRIRSVLLAGDDHRPLAEIAQEYGFQTGAHFSREFQAAFDALPRDVRANRTHN